jgi:hypothetical protein
MNALSKTYGLSETRVVHWARAALPLLLVGLLAGVAAACPTCREGLAENDPQGQSIAAGFYYSILFMMSVPYAILATFGFLAYRAVRRAKAQQATELTGSDVG